MSKEPSKNQGLIRKFLKRNLDKKELDSFNQKMQKEDFSNKVLEETVRLSSRSKLRSELKTIHKDVVVSKSRRNVTLAAASIIGLLGLSTFLYYHFTQKSSKPSVDLAFNTYFEPYPNVFKLRGGTDTKDQEFQIALEAYDNKKYEEASSLFGDMLGQGNSDEYVSFYYGVALLANDQITEAVPLLKNILSNNTSVLKEESRWYLALAYIKLNQKEKARKLLEEIQSNPGNFNSEKVNDLLQELNSLSSSFNQQEKQFFISTIKETTVSDFKINYCFG